MKNRYLKLLSFLPAILLMIMIFRLSSQPSFVSSDLSESFTYTIVKWIANMLFPSLNNSKLMQVAIDLNGLIRKLAHFTEYFLLAFTVALPFYIYRKNDSKLFLYTILICILYACSDEIHQYFVPGRACQFRDICIDSAGSCISLLFQYFILRLKKLLH